MRLRERDAQREAELERVNAELAVLQRLVFSLSSERARPEAGLWGFIIGHKPLTCEFAMHCGHSAGERIDHQISLCHPSRFGTLRSLGVAGSASRGSCLAGVSERSSKVHRRVRWTSVQVRKSTGADLDCPSAFRDARARDAVLCNVGTAGARRRGNPASA